MPVEIKICGLTDRAALEAALSACDQDEVRYVGFVFFPKSPRNICPNKASTLVAEFRDRARVVALLVDPNDDQVTHVMQTLEPDFLQLHGSESVERVKLIRQKSKVPIIKAVGVQTRDDVARAAPYHQAEDVSDLILFDAKPPRDATLPGGNGLTFDWRILKNDEKNVIPDRFMLSGGLTADNVAEAIKLTGATAVDVSSGVESAPGQKDPELIKNFIRAAKTVEM